MWDTGTGVAASVAKFNQVLLGGSFLGWTVVEYEGALGSDSCYNPGVDSGLVPEHPRPSGGSWTVSGANQWGPDYVGWTTAAVTYIRDHSPFGSTTPILIPAFPCGYQLFQVVQINCFYETPFVYDDVIQTGSVFETYVENCREGVCAYINY